MKKILSLTFMLVAFAFSAMADTQAYSDDLYVTINESSIGPIASTIYVTEVDGKYTLSLRNFILPSEENDIIPVGNVTLSDIEGVKNPDGSISLVSTQSIMLEDGDDPTMPIWMGPIICAGTGAIPVSLNATLTDDKLYALIDIDLSMSMGQVIKVTFGTPIESVTIGDANGDGNVTMADANKIANYYVNGTADGINLTAADVSGDGVVSMADANAVVNIFVAGSAE